MVVDDRTLEALEFPRILQALASETATPMGVTGAVATRPADDAATVGRLIALTTEALRHLEARGTIPFGTLADPRPAIARLEIEGSVLAPMEILDLLALLKAGRAVRSFLGEERSAFPGLWALAKDLPDLGNLIRFLDGAIAPSGEIEDHASDELFALRGDLRRRTERLAAALDALLARPEADRALQDRYISLRGGRHVVPVRAEARASLPGIVHGVSGSGATVFIEPMETVELNNEIVTLRDREAAEVQRLLRDYSDLLRTRLTDVRALSDALARLDVLMARARLARALGAGPPEPSTDGALRLERIRHPLVESSLRAEGRTIVPLDLAMAPDARVLVISGPNTGGKTVALKTVGLAALMHQAGLLVPAERSVLPIFRRVFIDIGDRQSITDGLSTFSARMRALATITGELAAPCLVLLDEVGTGTDPAEGAALAIATLDYCRDHGATAVATTHLESLKAHAALTPGFVNAGMEFDERALAPTYRLLPGIPARSGGLEIAERLGLPAALLEAARARLGEGGRMLSDYLARLQEATLITANERRAAEAERVALAGERAELRADFEAREARLRGALAAEIELALRAMREEGERYLEAIKDRHVAATVRRQEERSSERLKAQARELLRQARGSSPQASGTGPLHPGARVMVDGIGQRGVVESVRGDTVVLRVRGKRVTVRAGDCHAESVDPVALPAGASLPAGVRLSRRPGSGAGEELHLVGRTVDEALPLVDKYLDDAYLEGRTPVRLIHGMGSGRLRRAIAGLLARHPHVDSFTGAAPDQGGAGVTVVNLRI